MESLQFTQGEAQLATERRLKYQGSAKVNLEAIQFDLYSSRELDRRNVDRLCNIFREEGCHNIAFENRIPAIISPQDLGLALRVSNVNVQSLVSPTTSEIPHLQFPATHLCGLHGRHRVAAAMEVLPPSRRWWVVDLYLDDIGNELKTTLVEEYSNEETPSDGEIYRKIRQYANDGNLHGELRWKARLSQNSQQRLEALMKNSRLRHAFDRVLGIPGHRSAMRISMLHRIIAIKCDEEIAHYLNLVADFWTTLVNQEPTSIVKIDQQTVEKLQLMAPRVESAEVHGLVVSGQAFSRFAIHEREAIWSRLQSFSGLIPSLYAFFEDFKCFENWAQCLSRLFTVTEATVRATMERRWQCSDDNVATCLVQKSHFEFSHWNEPAENHFNLSYRQLWMYSMRHYPQMPRDPKRKTRLAKPTTATADESTVVEMATLAHKLGFRSNEITSLQQRSPDRLIARNALLQARKPDRFSYDRGALEAMIDQITTFFGMARPIDVDPAPSILLGPPVKQKARCGHPTVQDLLRDSSSLFLPYMHKAEVPEKVTTFYVRRCVYIAFFGQGPIIGEHTLDSDLFVPRSPASVIMAPADTPINDTAANDNYFRTRQETVNDSNDLSEPRVPLSTGNASGLPLPTESRFSWGGVPVQPAVQQITPPGNEASLHPPAQIHVENSRPVTQIDVAGLLTAWTEARLPANVTQLPDPNSDTSRHNTPGQEEPPSSGRNNSSTLTRRNNPSNPEETIQIDSTRVENEPSNEQDAVQGSPPSSQANAPIATEATPNVTGTVVNTQAYPHARSQARDEATKNSMPGSERLHQIEDARSSSQAHHDDSDMVDDIINMDAEQREMSTQRQPTVQPQPYQYDEANQTETEIASTLSQLQAGYSSARLNDTNATPARGPRPETQMDVAGIMAQWQERSTQSASRTSRKAEIPEKRTDRPLPQPSRPTGIGKKRRDRLSQTIQEVSRAGTRDAAIADHLEWNLADSNEASSTPLSGSHENGGGRLEVATGSTNGRQVRFDVSNENTPNEPGVSGPPGVVHPRPVTQYNFRRLAGNPQRGQVEELAQRSGDGRVNITIYLYENDEWKIVNVVRVDPSRKSELDRTLREYRQRDMLLHGMNMRTVSITSSFKAATADGANALLLIPQRTKKQMSRLGKQIQAPNVSIPGTI